MRILDERGASDPNHFDHAARDLNLPAGDVPRMVRVFRWHNPKIETYLGVREALGKLRDRFQLGLLTDGCGLVQRRKVEALRLEGFFETILYSDDLKTAKPDERLFGWFEDSLGAAGCQCVYVGDNPAKDFAGARRRHWKTIRVLTGEFRSVTAPADLEADQRIGGIDMLANLLLNPGADGGRS